MVLLYCPVWNGVSGTGLNCHASYNLSPLGTTISFTSPCARVFPPEWRVECPSDHGRHECVLPCLLVLLSSPLLTLVLTAESTVLVSLFVVRLRRGASENLFCAVSVRARPRLLYIRSGSREDGGGATMVGLSRVGNPFALGMRRSTRDIEVYCPLDTRGRIQGRILGASGGTCSGGGAYSARFSFIIYYPVYEVGLNLGRAASGWSNSGRGMSSLKTNSSSFSN